ncbi:MAG: thiamine-phosphate kinase, partial [Myxococcales bacterium]
TTTVLGLCARPVLRSGARPGDRLWLAGPVGLAAAGLRLLLSGHRLDGPDAPALQECVAAWRRPRARLAAGLAAAPLAASLIDISDGLAQDAGHLARASGVRLVLDADAIVELSGSSLQVAAAALGADPGELALAGGEDYALLAASAHDLTAAGFAPVGRVEAGAAGVRVVRAGADWTPPAGFDHGG